MLSKLKETMKIRKSKNKRIKNLKLLEAIEIDCDIFGEMRINSGLDVKFKTYKKCDFESHSEYLLRLHKEKDHKLKQTCKNLVLGYECDIKSHTKKFLNVTTKLAVKGS
jgi:hypothetical protein